MKREHSDVRGVSGGEGRHALALALLLAAGCASESGSATDAAIDHPAPVDTVIDDLGATRDAGMDAAVPRCVPGMSVACACVGGAIGAQTCSAEGVYGACVCPDASAPTDAVSDAWTLDIPARPLGPRLITPQSISRTTTQRPTFRWVLPDGVTRARVTVARNRALTMDVRTGMATGTSWRPTEPLPFAVWFWRVEGLGDDGGVVWTSPTWEFRAPRRDTAVDSSWGTWRDFNGDGHDDLALTGADVIYYGDRGGLRTSGHSLRPFPADSGEFVWRSFSGATVSDFNGDGVADLVYYVAGTRFVDDDAGTRIQQYVTRLVVYLGRVGSMGDRPDVALEDFGSLGVARYGSPSVGDFNGDGFGDIIVTEECWGWESCVLTMPPGIVAYWGSASGFISPPSILMTFKSTTQPHYCGGSADLDLDGRRDLVLDFGWWNPDALTNRRAIVSINTGRDLSVESPIEAITYLIDVDIDGDGHVDWVRGLTDEIDVFRWSDRGLVPTGWPTIAAPDLPSGIVGRTFGSRLAAGDVNGDGYADLVAGAPEGPLTSSSVNPRGAGSVYLFLGGRGGLSPVIATWRGRTLASSSGEDRFGDSISASSDIDGDGFDDIAIAAIGSNRIELRYGSEERSVVGARTLVVEGVSSRVTGTFDFVE